jgi:hypothetical protein
MKDFAPTHGKNEKFLIAAFNICRGAAMDDPTKSTTVNWGEPGGKPEVAELGDWAHGSPDISGTHSYSRPGPFTVTVRMETTCHYVGEGSCDFHCVATGSKQITVG